MNLDQLIQHSYGIADLIFAGHELDRQRALQALIVANEEEVGYAEFLEKHRQFLRGRNCTQEHIDEQIKRVKKLSLYFALD